MDKTSILTFCIAFACASCATRNYTDYVEPRVGTDASESPTASAFGKKTEVLGQTLPAVLMPNGMNFWTPQTRDTELKGVSPYYYGDSLLQGFRNSHWIVGGCTQDFGSMTLMPLGKELKCLPKERAARFSHSDEVSKPYYYSATLPDAELKAEMTATSRAAIFRISYDYDGEAYFVINPNNDEDKGFIAIDPHKNMVYGWNPVYRIYQGKGQPAGFSGYFVVQFPEDFIEYGCYQDTLLYIGRDSIGNANNIGCYVKLKVSKDKPLLVKAASSFTGIDGALLNLETELPTWDFDGAKGRLKDAWESHLGRIKVESPNEEDLRNFYGAFYRASFLPQEINDVDGRYPAFATADSIDTLPAGESRYFDGFSMWDTYRALHPLLNVISPSTSGEMMQSLVHKYEQGGWMPIFPCWNSYTAAMIGDHCASAFADAYLKGVRNFDAGKAYEGLRKNAFETPCEEEYIDGKGRRALPSYLKYGYIPVEDTVPYAYHRREQVSRTLEYSFDDYALAQFAKALGHDNDFEHLNARAQNYRNAINPATGYADVRDSTGRFLCIDPFQFSKNITEGAPCHYTWYVPHDPQGLMQMMGGREKYVEKLDSMFSEARYWHGNEPCHQVAYMYNFANEPRKTSAAVRDILKNEYRNTPGGLSGNDDAGQMSAWYMFAAMGFYPVCPAWPYYAVSGPIFPYCEIELENGKKIVFRQKNASPENIYVKRITHDGVECDPCFISHDELMQGGEWIFEMTNK